MRPRPERRAAQTRQRPARRAAAVHLALAAATLALVAGCGTPAGGSEDPPAVPSSATDPAVLTKLKADAGIADCPVSDPDVAPVAGGLPDVRVACLGGGRDVRLAGLRGTPMMVNVWGQWCGPCREEAPYLSEVAAGDHRGLMILGIDYDDPRPDYALEFAQLSAWRYPQLADPDRRLAGPLKISGGPPQTLFVDAAGRIVYRHAGPFTSADQIRTAVREHLGVRLG